MGYHDAREIPNYWTYAQNFVLQDNMFESTPRGAGLSIYLWSQAGRQRARTGPIRCRASARSEGPPDPRYETKFYAEHSLPWTDITYLLHKYGVSWRYYVFEGERARLRGRRSDDVRAGETGP